jgi:hypothetical protein
MSETQAGNARGHGDGTADGANGTNNRPSHGCETIPSTIGAMPESNGERGGWGAPAPPIAICVPFGWPTGTLLGGSAYPPRSGSGQRTSQPVQIVVGPPLWVAVTHIFTRSSLPVPFVSYVYLVRARTSGGGVGSSRPLSEGIEVYCLLFGLTGLLGSSDRSFAVKLLFDGRARGAGVARTGTGVGRIATGRAGALALFGPLP